MSEPQLHPHLALVHRLLRAIEQGDEAALLELFAPHVQQREFPNRLLAHGAERGLPELLDGFRRGKHVVANQRYEVTSSLVDGERVAVEVRWTAELKVPLGRLAAGDTMAAHCGMFFRIAGGRIAEQHTFDCFEPF
ncbi:MAG TPA: nuclear transport factor 2 family protein [Polyangiaceae bacterium]|nr:nuclear transport factor 2 family protein [Polyangiaceae bacterium]